MGPGSMAGVTKRGSGDGPDRQDEDWFDSVEFPPGHDIA